MKKFLFFISLIALFSACTKEAVTTPTNNTNRKEITISGRILDKATNKGMAKQSILIKTLKKDPYCVLCGENQINSVETDVNGNYSVKVTVDVVEDAFVKVEFANRPSGFVCSPSVGYETIATNQNAVVNFALLPSTTLQIKLNRSQKDKFESVSLSHFITLDGTQGEYLDYIESDYTKAQTKVFNVEVVADAYTKIYLKKGLGNNKYEEKTDSILCKKGVANKIELDF